jgi:hypothetical protein
MMSASLPQISRKPRAHSHKQRRHDERKLAANFVLTAIYKDDMVSANLPQLIMGTAQQRQQITFKEVNQTLWRNLKLNLNLLLSCGS